MLDTFGLVAVERPNKDFPCSVLYAPVHNGSLRRYVMEIFSEGHSCVYSSCWSATCLARCIWHGIVDPWVSVLDETRAVTMKRVLSRDVIHGSRAMQATLEQVLSLN